MKVTQVIHSWNRMTRDWSGVSTFDTLETLGGSGFDQSQVQLSGGLLVLAGVNSGGKSRLLASIWSEINDPGVAITRLTWKGSQPAKYTFVDLFELLSRQWEILQSTDLREQVEAAGLTDLRPAHRQKLSFVVGRDYDRISVAELEYPSSDYAMHASRHYRPDVVPYFEVSAGNRTYNSGELSRGELSAMTLHWVLQGSTRDEMLLIDEPDLMLSPLSARRALDLIVEESNSRKTPVVLATHSYLGLATSPASAQVLIRMSADGTSILTSPSEYALWDALRVDAPIKVAFIVEDRMAQVLLGVILDLVDYSFPEQSAIWIAGDASKVVMVGKLPAFEDFPIQLWGVLDGNEADPSVDLKLLKLPGPDAPEEGVVRISTTHPDLVSKSKDRIARVLSRTVGEDPHDRALAIAKALGMEAEHLLGRVWGRWLTETEDGQEALSLFAKSIKRVTPF